MKCSSVFAGALMLLVSIVRCSGEVIQEFEILEGVAVGTSVGFIGGRVQGSSQSPPPPPYLIVPVPGSSVDSDLTIDQSNGEILTRIVLDRETRDSYSLVAIPMSGENIRVLIKVKDQNDHAPQFPTDFMAVDFPENTPRDVKRTLQPAKDKDLDIYNTQRYVIAGGNLNNAFRLSSHRERDGVLYLDLQVNGFLDRETTPAYSLLIEAFDGGVPPLKGSITINITITDQNDNAPIWQFPRILKGESGEEGEILNQSRYFGSIAENATVGTSVLQVHATDIDQGENGQVEYLIKRRQTEKDSAFRIDSTSGIILVDGPLDFETKEVYELVLLARDHGLQPLETTVFVTIRLQDINDNQIDIKISFFSGDDWPPRVSEKAMAGEYVARISVIDPETKQEYKNINMSLSGDEGHFALETVNSAVYLVVASRPLDRELKPSFNLKVSATERGNPYLNASTSFTLQVEDDNDSPPQFDKGEYHANLIESSPPNTFVIQLKGRDEDSAENARLSYSFLESSDWFEIDEESAVIRTKSILNCQLMPTPKLTVIAKDHGKPQLSGSTSLFIHLIDTNHTPIFERGFYNASVGESAPTGTCLLKVYADDPDCGINAELTYGILSSPRGSSSPFSINSKSGEICLNAQLDYETKTRHQLLVTASDTGGLSSTAVVSIQVLDENDNVPNFAPSRTVLLTLKEGHSGQIAKLYAVDDDSGSFGQVTYSLINSQGKFSLNEKTGELSINGGVSKVNPINLQVGATDGGGQEAKEKANVTIFIVGSALQSTLFTKPKYTFNIKETVAIGYTITTLTLQGSGRARYSILSGDGQSTFTLDSYTGALKTARKLNYAQRSIYLLNVQAQLEGSELTSYSQVEVLVGDENDNSPEFEWEEVKLWIPENVPLGTLVYSALATDGDKGLNGEIRYSLVDNPAGIFKLDKVKGHLTIAKGLDYEKSKGSSVIISSNDLGSPPRRSKNLTLIVQVQDSNDNSPIFYQRDYEFWIGERSPPGTFVGRIGPGDGKRGATNFIIHPPSNLFNIQLNSGVISRGDSGLAANSSKVEFQVIAYTSEADQPKATFNVRINLQSSKQLQKGSEVGGEYWVNVSESAEVGSVLLDVIALDEDSGSNGRLTYSLVPSPRNSAKIFEYFELDGRSGGMRLKSPLDREKEDFYLIHIMATDHGIPPLSSTSTINIRVTDENDNSPIFNQELFRFTLVENNEGGVTVGQLSATDKDNGKNASIRYYFQPLHQDFSIDEFSGVIKARSSLDREKEWIYELQAVAIDEGDPPKQSQVIVQIRLTDLNDNEPIIVEPDQDFLTLPQGLPPQTQLTKIIANDMDEGLNAQITYSILKGDGVGDEFSIESSSGIVRTRKVLDKKGFYTLRVKASDMGSPQRDSTREYRIQVVDIKDSRVDSLPSKLTLKVFENATVGQVVGSVKGSLVDNNSPLNFKIISGNVGDAFEINGGSGQVVVGERLDYETTPSYIIQVEVRNELRVSPLSLHIQVIDVNDERPSFKEDPTQVFIPENASLLSPLANLGAVDRDGGLNGIIHYSISYQKPEGKFRLNILTGELYLESPLDYELCSNYLLVIVATDQGPHIPSRLNSSLTVYIQVGDENDNAPLWTSPSRIEMYESEPLGTSFHTLVALDLDSGDNGKVSYEILNKQSQFNLDPLSGRLSLAKPLDSEVKRLEVNLSATDNGNPPKRSTQLLTIEVKGESSNSPRFSTPHYEGKVKENSPLGTQILKLNAFKSTHPSDGSNVSVGYVIPGGVGDDKFGIEMSSGWIYLKGEIDREEESFYSLVIYLQDEGGTHIYDTATANIEILDENDNAPDFRHSCTKLSVPENNELGVIHVFTAFDPDVDKNGEVTFLITGGNTENMFSLDLHSGRLSGRALDRERKGDYALTILAADQGSPPMKTICNLSIHVQDENDSPITFLPPPNHLKGSDGVSFVLSESGGGIYSASIGENVGVGTTVLQVQAMDNDIGLNSLIKYSLNNESHWHFTIDNRTGAILTAGPLDREKMPSYVFEVAATDGGLYDLRSSTASVHFTITDYNDNRPQFVENPLVLKIGRNVKRGERIGQLLATDPDEGLNGEINYTLEKGDPRFKVNRETGEIFTERDLRDEKPRVFHLQVKATDNGRPQLESRSLLVIQVGEPDLQHSLKFTSLPYSTRIKENSPPGTQLIKVNGVRNDGRRGQISYSIVGGNEEGIFGIDSSSGDITVTNSNHLDREKYTEISLVISGMEEGNPPLYAHALVDVTLADLNDNFPRFTQESYVASVWEGNTRGTFVTQVTATDSDEGGNANLLYHIIDGNRDNAFVIEPPFSGIVKTNIVLDREILDEYKLTIIATDEGSPQMTGTAYLHVNVIDIQDQSPVFPPHSVIWVKEDIPVGTLITTMVANDVDTNPTLVYSFLEGENSGMFSIGKYSGRVTLLSPLDFESKRSFTSKVQVSDSVHTATTTLTLNVQDANDHRPLFSKPLYRIIISEGAKAGTRLAQVNATDEDSGADGEIVYSLSIPELKGHRGQRGQNFNRGQSFLRIDEKSGVIYLNGSVPTDGPPFTQLVVHARDKGTPPKSSTASLWTEIRPSHSHILKFSSPKYKAEVERGAKRGSLVIQLTVEQRDSLLRKNLHFHFSILSGNEREFFTINSHSGEVFVGGGLEGASESSFTLVISAECVDMDQCNSLTQLQINLSHKKEEKLTFEKTLYTLRVSESKEIGSNLLKVSASSSPGGKGPLGLISYKITSGNEQNLVTLNELSGVLTLRSTLDYEREQSYSFVIKGELEGGEFNFTRVLIQIDDENDNEPRFLFSQYLGSVGENEPPGTEICTVRASDLDGGIYGKLQYSILEGEGKDKFSIAPSTGVLSTGAVFDYESKSRYYLTLRANDIGGKSSTTKVSIEITSRDEYAPQFLQKSYSFVIPRNADEGHQVGRVEASDADRGPDGRLLYQFVSPSPYFSLNSSTGVLRLRGTPTDQINTTFTIEANSGRKNSKSARVSIQTELGEALKELEVASSVGDWLLGVLVTALLLLIILCALFLLFHLRAKRQRKKKEDPFPPSNNFDTLEYAGPQRGAGGGRPPKSTGESLYGSHYGNLMDLRGRGGAGGGNTLSELSEGSNSASSGRGSAEEGEEVEEDEEICMINGALGGELQEGGLHLNDSLDAAKNTEEYLARLGIRPKTMDELSYSGGLGPGGGSVGADSNNYFDERERDISSLIYAQISEDNVGGAKGSLTSILHNEDELAGSYNWDYLLDWGPQYEPLANVFSEIAHLKEERTGPDSPYSQTTRSAGGGGGGGNLSSNYNKQIQKSKGESKGGDNNKRSWPLPPLPILSPRSPIPNELNFPVGPISPSFSPALSPLANRSPSISPLGPLATNNIRASQLQDNYSSQDLS